MDLLIDSESLVKEVHSPVATGYHEFPLDLLCLDLSSSVKVDDGLLELVLLGVMHTKARDNIDLGWVVAEGLLVVVHCLELILLLLV